MATTRLQIGPADQGRMMSLEEFQEAEELPGSLYELARGVLEVTEIPGDDHGQIVHNIHESFSDFNRRHPGLILRIGHGSDIRFIIPELDSDRHPDLALVLRGASRDRRGRRRAALAVEVVSPGKAARERDYLAKREEYLVLGLLEYWIVDPLLLQVTVLIRQGDPAHWGERVFRGENAIVSDMLPQFQGRVDEFWANVERDGNGE